MDRAGLEAAAARLYVGAGLSWHGNVDWVTEPYGRWDKPAHALRRCRARRYGWWRTWGRVALACRWAILCWAACWAAGAAAAAIPAAVLEVAYRHRAVVGLAVTGMLLLTLGLMVLGGWLMGRGRENIGACCACAPAVALLVIMGESVASAYHDGVSYVPDVVILLAAAALGAMIGVGVGLGEPAGFERAAIELVGLPAQLPGDAVPLLGEQIMLRPGDQDAAGAAARIRELPAWAWRPCRDVLVICAPPTEISLERVGDRMRLHRADGPARRWPYGSREYWWHGTRVGLGALRGAWSAARIQRITDTEQRRAAIEIIGWPEFVRRAELRLVSRAPDPGNPGHELVPHRLRDGRGLLLMTNGSPDRDGGERVYAETVPGDIADPIHAAAWQYGIGAADYQQLQRRT